MDEAETILCCNCYMMSTDWERCGDSIGTDGCAQVIEMVLTDVEQEIYGPAERLRE